MISLNRELGGKRLELLKEAVPKLLTWSGFLLAGHFGQCRDVKEVPVAARTLRLTLQPWEVRVAGVISKGIRCTEQAAP